MSKFTLNRRTLLRGMVGGSAVGLGLPLLEAMLNTHGEALANGGALPLRFISYHWADGIVIDQWEPPTTGAGYALSPALQPLAPVKDFVSVISGMRNHNGQVMTHHDGMPVFSGHPIQPAAGLNSNVTGPTIDQVIADVPGVADRTPVRAVHVQISKRISTDGDGGTTVTAISHRDGGGGNLIPQIPEYNPAEIWQNLFGTFVPQVDDRDLRTSVLDFVRGDAERLKTRLGAADKARLDSHLQGISELEAKISAVTPICDLAPLPTETNQDSGGQEPISAVVDAMAELIGYAFVCDITRVATVEFKRFVSSTVFSEIAASDQHHSSSHFGPSNPNYQAGVTYQMAKFADLLVKLQGFTDPTGGTLLDSSIIFAASECSTGQAHSVDRQPMLVAGGGRGYLANPGVHYQATPWNGSHNNPSAAGNTTDVLLACLQAFDPGATSLGSGALESTSPLSAIVA